MTFFRFGTHLVKLSNVAYFTIREETHVLYNKAGRFVDPTYHVVLVTNQNKVLNTDNNGYKKYSDADKYLMELKEQIEKN